MRTFVVLLSLFALARAGVQIATPEIEEAALQLWEKFCGGDSEGGMEDDGATFVFCKKAPQEKIEETHTHEHNLGETADGKEKQNVIFVAQPAIHYKHDVVLSGSKNGGGKTVIYVKSQKNTHEINVQDKTTAGGEAQKPTLYFLKGNHGGEDAVAATAERRRR